MGRDLERLARYEDRRYKKRMRGKKTFTAHLKEEDYIKLRHFIDMRELTNEEFIQMVLKSIYKEAK